MAAVLICLLCLFSVAIAFFVKAKKEQNEVNTSTPVATSGKKQNYKIQNDDLDKSLNDNEAESLDDA